MLLVPAVTASEENWWIRGGRWSAIVDQAVRGCEDAGGNDKGRCSKGGAELDRNLSLGCF